jgi:hypothetical protein
VLFVLLRDEGVAPGLALIGGAALQILPISRYFYYNSHLNLMDWFWLPGVLLIWKQLVKAIPSPTSREIPTPNPSPLSGEGSKGRGAAKGLLWAVILGFALYGLLMTDHQFPIFASFVLVPYGLWTFWVIGKRTRTSASLQHDSVWRPRLTLIALGIVGLMVGVALAWFAGPLPYALRFEGELIPSPVEERPGVPFPAGLFTMSQTWWHWETPSLGGFVIPAILAGVVCWVIFSRGVQLNAPTTTKSAHSETRFFSPPWFWCLVMLPPLIFALGPSITIGEMVIPMPFRWLYDLTNGMFRMPWRLAPVAVIAGMLFAGKVWTGIIYDWVGTRRALSLPVFASTVVFLLLTISVRLFETAPLQPILYPYEFYNTMGQEKGKAYDEYVIIEAPTGAGTGEVLVGNTRAIQFQFYGMTHGKRMVNGFISRAPADAFFHIVTDDPMLSWLGQRRFLQPELVEAQLREQIYGWPIGYIVIHKDYIESNTRTLQEILGYLNSLRDLLCPVFIEGEAVVYRTAWHPDGCPERIPPEIQPGTYQIDIGSPDDQRYIGWGWHWQENVSGLTARWSGEYPQTHLYLDLPLGDYQLSLSAQAFSEAREVRVLVNDVVINPSPCSPPHCDGEGLAVGTVNISPDTLQTYSFDLPAEVVGDGQNLTITLDYDDVIVPAEIGQGTDERKLALLVDWVRFTTLEDSVEGFN